MLPETVNNHIKETQTSKILCQAIAFLKPVPKTNGLEKSPTYQVMGEPIYWDELVRNYKQLVVKWHPDNNPSVEAVGRIQLITQIYQELKTHWMTKYSPLIRVRSKTVVVTQTAIAKISSSNPMMSGLT